MPGCTCSKPIGFKGLHKIECPVRGKKTVGVVPATKATVRLVPHPSPSNFVLSDFRSAVMATGHAVLLKRVLTDCANTLRNLPGITGGQRKKVESAVRAMLEQLEN